MKKLLTVTFVTLALVFAIPFAIAQPEEEAPADTSEMAQADTNAPAEPVKEEPKKAEPKPEPIAEKEPPKKAEDKVGFTQQVKDYFIDGGVEFMSIVLICLVLGLAISIERMIALGLATTNTKKLLERVLNGLRAGGVGEAKEICKSTPGPVASIFAQGLIRVNEGAESVEKSILNYGEVEMGKLERGLTWISLFISLAPLFGFMGTVIGMIDAFSQIEASKTIEISEIADGIKTALLTTVAGLVVAVILQIFYNYCVSKIDSIVNDMDEASIAFVDMLIAEDVLADNN